MNRRHSEPMILFQKKTYHISKFLTPDDSEERRIYKKYINVRTALIEIETFMFSKLTNQDISTQVRKMSSLEKNITKALDHFLGILEEYQTIVEKQAGVFFQIRIRPRNTHTQCFRDEVDYFVMHFKTVHNSLYTFDRKKHAHFVGYDIGKINSTLREMSIACHNLIYIKRNVDKVRTIISKNEQ